MEEHTIWSVNPERRAVFAKEMKRWLQQMQEWRKQGYLQKMLDVPTRLLSDVSLHWTAFYLASFGKDIQCLGKHITFPILHCEIAIKCTPKYYVAVLPICGFRLTRRKQFPVCNLCVRQFALTKCISDGCYVYTENYCECGRSVCVRDASKQLCSVCGGGLCPKCAEYQQCDYPRCETVICVDDLCFAHWRSCERCTDRHCVKHKNYECLSCVSNDQCMVDLD